MPARLIVALAVLGAVVFVRPAAVRAECEVVAVSTGASRGGGYGKGSSVSGKVSVEMVCGDPTRPAAADGWW